MRGPATAIILGSKIPVAAMKRLRPAKRSKLSPETENLLHLATGLGQSNCRIEDTFWTVRLAALVERLLKDQEEAVLIAALDQLYGNNNRAYDALADLIEAGAESRQAKDGEFDLLLIVVPILAWSRFSIPSGSVSREVLANVRVQLAAHVLAKDVRLGLADFFYSPDQLPQSYCDTGLLTDKLGKAALHNRDLHIDPKLAPQTNVFLSDTRYLLGVVSATSGAPLFRWQEENGDRAQVLKVWSAQGGETLRPLLAGCASEPLLPQSYHAGCRDADHFSRPYSLRASVAFLSTTLNITPSQLRCVVASYHEQRLEEFRIGFILRETGELVHGAVWPLLDGEDEATETPAEIEALLREMGVGEVLVLDQRLPVEYCDDCGAPLFPNAEGESVHAEMPEEQAEAAPRHLH